jgi:phosphatidate cytidylyltransferase|mmetsp:Transcript_42220/g.55624  ORF Transcript_42220/g.55624 Transcript_42220/m.55624 type:complete len:99 (-) Transcript_42220:166-462(-)
MEPITFVASELQLHLFVITVFIAFIAPFGGFLFAGLKRAMRQSHLSISIFKGGVIDRLDCIIITGCFVLIYMNMLVIRNEVPEVSAVLDMVADLSEKA